MQGLLRNPLADGSTLGVSSGAALGAVLAIATGVSFPGLAYAGTMVMAMAFAFGSLALILALSYAMDRSLSTNTIILMGVVFSMFASALMSLIITFAGEKVRSITFWTMGSLSGSSYANALTLLGALIVCGGVLLWQRVELNAFAVGEENARHVGVPVRRVKLTVMIAVSVLIGVCVSIGGTIGFVGLVMPHMARMLAGPNHRRLLPSSLFSGAIFLMLCDLAGAHDPQPPGIAHRGGHLADRRDGLCGHLPPRAHRKEERMLICENVRVRYGEACVLAGVDLRIRAGEWWMLIGPNGAGKSTLVNAIARSVPYEGRVLFNGVDTRSLRHAQFARHIGVLSQRNLANYAFRVEEIVRMGRYAYRGMSAAATPRARGTWRRRCA